MAVLLPFRAFRSPSSTIYVPGEEPPLSFLDADLIQDEEPALFVYRQRFRFPGDKGESVRMGVMGVLNREEALVLPHEEVCPERVAACVEAMNRRGNDLGSLWLWCDDCDGSLADLTRVAGTAPLQALDRFECLHELWPVTDDGEIERLQSNLAGRTFFVADGHHRFAAGWNLATIQIRSEALRTRPAYRLVGEKANLEFYETNPICLEDVGRYLASAAGSSRYVVVKPGPELVACELAPGVQVHRLLSGLRTQAVRDVCEAIHAVQAGHAHMALLMPSISIAQIERDAIDGILLPPKSTDFFPKLAAGLVIHRH